MSLLTVGTVALDTIETAFGKRDKVVGGAAMYIGLAASKFTTPINLVSVVGGDFPSDELAFMQSLGINLDGLQVKNDEKSFFWAGKYHDDMNGRDTLATELNVLAEFNPILPEAYKKPDYVMLGNLTPEIQMQVLDQLKKKPKLVAMDTMNFWMDVAWDALMQTIKKVDMLLINDEEARQMSGEHSLMKAAKAILKMGPKVLVIKKGEHGALLFQDNDVFYAPALPLEEVVDPTGAGDTFAGGMMGYLAMKDQLSVSDFKKAIIVGSAMASFCVEKFSNERMKEITQNMVRMRIKQFEQLVKFGAPL